MVQDKPLPKAVWNVRSLLAGARETTVPDPLNRVFTCPSLALHNTLTPSNNYVTIHSLFTVKGMLGGCETFSSFRLLIGMGQIAHLQAEWSASIAQISSLVVELGIFWRFCPDFRAMRKFGEGEEISGDRGVWWQRVWSR